MENLYFDTDTDTYLTLNVGFGIDLTLKKPFAFLNNSIFVYLIGCNIVLKNLNNSKKQTIRSFKCKGHVESFNLVKCPRTNKDLVILLDVEIQKSISNLYIIELETKNNDTNLIPIRKKLFENVLINSIDISSDLKLIACHSNYPNSNLQLFSFDKLELLTQIKTIDSNRVDDQTVDEISFFHNDLKKVLIIGQNLVKMLLITKKGLKLIYNIDSKIPLKYHCWMNKNEVICFDKYSGLYLIEPKQNLVKRIYLCNDDLRNSIKLILCTQRLRGIFLLRESENQIFYYDYTFAFKFKIKLPNATNESIVFISINKNETQIAAISNVKSFYSFDLNDFLLKADNDKNNTFEFEKFTNSCHYDAIRSVSSCVAKSLVATCSLDQNLIIWNYETKLIELKENFKNEELHMVAFHPSGLYLIVTTSTLLKYMAIYFDSFKLIHSLNVRQCNNCIFSNGGQLFAFVHGTVIQIYSSVDFSELCSIKTQEMGKIKQLRFNSNDNYLLCCSMSGTVCVWDVYNQSHVFEIMTKGLSYIGLALHPNQEWLFLISTEKSLRQFILPKRYYQSEEQKSTLKQNGEAKLFRKIETNLLDENVTCIETSNSGKIVCLGMSKGTIQVFRMPCATVKQYRCHFSSINKICFTHNDEYMVSASEDGSLLYWNVQSNLRSSDDEYLINWVNFNELVLYSKNNYLSKNNIIRSYDNKISECKFETDTNLRFKQIIFDDKIRKLTIKHKKVMSDLMKKIESIKLNDKMQSEKFDENFALVTQEHLNEFKVLDEMLKRKIHEEDLKINELINEINFIKNEIETTEIELKCSREKCERDQCENIEKRLQQRKESHLKRLMQYEQKVDELLKFEDEIDIEAEEEIIEAKIKFKRKRDILNLENNDLAIKVKQSNFELKQEEVKLDESKRENQIKEKELNRLVEKYLKLKENENRLLKELDKYNKENKTLEEEHFELKENINSIETNNSMIKEHIINLEKEKIVHQEYNKLLKKQLDEIRGEIKHKKVELDQKKINSTNLANKFKYKTLSAMDPARIKR